MRMFSVESHRAFVNFFTSQSGVNPGEYYQELLAWVRKEHTDLELDHTLSTLKNTAVEMPAELLGERLPHIARKDANKAMLLFLTYEGVFE